MADNEMQVSLSVEVDKAALESTRKALGLIAQALEKLQEQIAKSGAQQEAERAAKASEQAAKSAAREVEKAAREKERAEKQAAREAAKAAKEAEKEIIKAAKERAKEEEKLRKEKLKAEEKAAKEAAKTALEIQQEQFDETSKRVSLAGDAESNLRTVGGAIGAFGGESAAGAIGAVAEIPAVIEALPRMKEAFVGLPQAIGAAATSLGPIGLVAAGTLIAVAGAITFFAAQSQETAKQITRSAEAIRSVNQQIAGGLTQSEAQSRLAEVNRLREAEAATLAELEGQYNKQVNELGGVRAFFERVGGIGEEALVEQLNKSKDAMKEMDAEARALEQSLNSAALAANEAANALRAGLDAQQGLIADLVNGMTSTEAQGLIERARLNAEYQRAEIERLQGLLAALETSDPKFQVVTEAIQTANDNLNAAQGQIEAYSAALAQGKFAANDAKKAAEEQAQASKTTTATVDKAAQEQQRAAEQAAQKAEQAAEAYRNAGQKLTDSIDNANRGYTNAIEDIRRKAADGLKDLNRDYQRDLLDGARKAQEAAIDAQQKFNDDEAKRIIDHQRNLRNIQRDAQKAERDAIRNQDALALALAREQANEQISEAEEANQEQGQDAKTAFAQQQRDLQTALQRERAERQTAYQRSLSDAREAQQREIRDAGIARSRALQLAQEAYQKELALLREKFAAEVGMYQQAAQAAGARGNAAAPSSSGPVSEPRRYGTSGLTINVNGAMNPGAVSNAIVQQLGRVGLT